MSTIPPVSFLELNGPYSYVEYVGDGSTSQFSIPFPYLDRAHIHVLVNDNEATFGFISDGAVLVVPTPAADADVVVQRRTPASLPDVSHVEGALLRGRDLNRTALQLLYALQESIDSGSDAQPVIDALLRTDLASASPGFGAALVKLASGQNVQAYSEAETASRVAADAQIVSNLAATTGTPGAGLVGFKQAGSGTVARTVSEKLGDDVTVWDRIPGTEKAAILAQSSTYDASAALNAVAAERRLDVPEGKFSIDATLDIARGLAGRSARKSVIAPSANTYDAVSLTDTSADFQQIADFSVVYPSLGVGRGVVLENLNNNVEVNRVNVQKAARGFTADLVAFMQRYQQCRTDFCSTGFYAQGLNGGGTGAGTTVIYDQCYVSNGNGTDTGWNLNNIRSVTMIQPTADMGGLSNVITCTGVGQLNILDHHFEGTPGGDGSYIKYTTSGSLAAGIHITGGCLEIADLSGRTFRYLDIQANDDTVRVTLENVNVRSLTGGANAKLAKLSGAAGSHIEIIAINCDFGALEGLFDTSALSGTYSYRRIDQEKPLLARGVTSVINGGTIATGVAGGLDGKHVFVQVRVDTTTLPTVMAHVTETYSGSGNIQVKFSKLSDGTADTGTYPVQWAVIG